MLFPSCYTVSGLLIQLPKRAGYVIFDAGEGTWGQIVRFFGVEGSNSGDGDGDGDGRQREEKKRQEEGETAYDVLRTLKCIFISHIHADHHAGLGRILALRAKVRRLSPLSLPFIFHSAPVC